MALAKNCTRININMPNELLVRVEDYAKKMNINRTSAICVLLNQFFYQEDAMDTIKKAVAMSGLPADLGK